MHEGVIVRIQVSTVVDEDNNEIKLQIEQMS